MALMVLIQTEHSWRKNLCYISGIPEKQREQRLRKTEYPTVRQLQKVQHTCNENIKGEERKEQKKYWE